MLFLQISKHTSESCPMHNQNAAKSEKNFNAKIGELLKKYQIKIVGSWVSIPEHLKVTVYDAANMEALTKLSMEPEVMDWLGYQTTEIKPVITIEESIKLVLK